MAFPSLDISLVNGALGQLEQNDDGVCGLVMNIGAVAPSGLGIATAKQGLSLADFEAVGITAAYDTANSVKCWRNIKEFYDTAGTGAELWVWLVSQATLANAIVDKTNNHLKGLLDAAGGKLRMVGIVKNPASGYTPTVTQQIDADIVSAITTAQALADDYQAAFRPVQIFLEAFAFTGTTSSLTDLKALGKPNVSLLLGNTETGTGFYVRAAIGLLLGRLSGIPVQRNCGRVKDGSLPVNQIYIGATTQELAASAAEAAHDKGFITFRKYTGRAGYFFSDDPTCSLATSDYNSVARRRVVDKAIRLAYVTYVNEILDEVLIDPATGKMQIEKAKYYQSIIQRAIDNAMTANAEVSGFKSIVDPAQNVLSTNKITVDMRIVPVGYAKQISIKLGFATSV